MMETAPQFGVGLDLAQCGDFSALAVVQKITRSPDVEEHQCRHLRRWPLGTSYVQIVADVAGLTGRPELSGAVMAADQTGVGRAVIDVFRVAALRVALLPVTITGGTAASRQPDGSWHLPKKDLVATLQVLFSSRRIVISASLPEARVLVKELRNFRVKVTASANETFGAGQWREGRNDDLVLALALACWAVDRAAAVIPPGDEARSMTAGAPAGVFGADTFSHFPF